MWDKKPVTASCRLGTNKFANETADKVPSDIVGEDGVNVMTIGQKRYER